MNTSKAQTISQEILLNDAKNLLKIRFIEESELEILQERIVRKIFTKRNELLKFLMECNLSKATGQPLTIEIPEKKALSSNFSFNIYQNGIPRRTAYYTFENSTAEAIQNIQKLAPIGFIKDFEVDDLLKKINDSSNVNLVRLSDWYAVLTYCIEKNDFDDAINSQAFANYVKNLQDLDLIEPENINNLIQAKDDFFTVDILSLLKNQITIHFADIPKNTEEAYNYLFQKIFSLFPSYTLKQLKYTPFTQDNDLDAIASIQLGKLSLWINEKEVTFEVRDKINSNRKSFIFFQNIEKINHFLSEQNENYRIFYFENSLINRSDAVIYWDSIQENTQIKIGFIKLTREQHNFLSKKEQNYEFAYFNPFWYKISVQPYSSTFDIINSKDIRSFLYQIQQIGLLNHIESEKLNTKIQDIPLQQFTSYAQLLSYFDNNMTLNMDWEMSNDKKPYQKLFLRFSDISKGYFLPTEIVDDFDFDKKTANIGFTFNGKKYQTKIKVSGDWYDESFLTLIQKAIKEAGMEYRFYTFESTDQTSTYIFLNKKQFEFLKSNHIFQFEPIPINEFDD